MTNIKSTVAKTHTPEYLLHKYWARKPHNIISSFLKDLVPEGGVVVDPFCGSGVVLREAQKLGLTAFGFDVNPIACLISSVLVNPPTTDDFKNAVEAILDSIGEIVNESYSENGSTIRYCMHSIIVKCARCGQIQDQAASIAKNRKGYCNICDAKLRFNLESLHSTEIKSIVFDTSKEMISDSTILQHQMAKSNSSLFDIDINQYSFEFSQNRRILAFHGMKTSDLFTPRNFSILSQLSNEFSKIKDEKVKKAALLLLSASAAQCSRLIANRNNLSSGGPAWSIPGFWVPADHLETNPIIHLKARLKKFIRGLDAINKNIPTHDIFVDCIDSRVGLDQLTSKGIKSDLVFFDPPYGDNVPYVEFSSIWNSFLGVFPNPESDISVSDRLSRDFAWKKYNQDINSSIKSIVNNLKDHGKLLITFNNNDMRAWETLLSALQNYKLSCEYATYQIPAVVSSKAQKAIENSYISDIYAIYKKSETIPTSLSLSNIIKALTDCAKFRGGKISKSLAQRIMIIAWLKNNTSANLIPEMSAIIDSLFIKDANTYKLNGFDELSISPFVEISRSIAKDSLKYGPCEFATIYNRVSTAVADFGIPDYHELRSALEEVVTFSGNRCLAYNNKYNNEQISIFDFT